MPGDARLRFFILSVQPSDADVAAVRRQDQTIAYGDRSRVNRTDHDDTRARQGKSAIDGEPEATGPPALACLQRGRRQNGFQRVDPIPTMRRHRQYIDVGEHGFV